MPIASPLLANSGPRVVEASQGARGDLEEQDGRFSLGGTWLIFYPID